jgi:hypothetical protein
LKDCFEWDVLNPSHTIEEFAKQTVADLGLPREFETVICVEMRRQIYFHMFRAAYDEAAAWDRGILLFNYWMEQLPSWGAVRPPDTVQSFQPTLRPLAESSRPAATSVQETLRNALPASAPGRSAVEDAIAAQTSSDPRRVVPLTLPTVKRIGPTAFHPDPISVDQQTLFTAELQRIMGPMNRKTGRLLFANVDLFNLDPPHPVQIREFSMERESTIFNPNKPINFDVLQFDLEGQPSWMRPRDPNSGRFLTKKEIEILRRKALEARDKEMAEKGENGAESSSTPVAAPVVAAPAPVPPPAAAMPPPPAPAKETPAKKKKPPTNKPKTPRTPKTPKAASAASPAGTPASGDDSTPNKKRGRPPKRKADEITPVSSPAASTKPANAMSIDSLLSSAPKRPATESVVVGPPQVLSTFASFLNPAAAASAPAPSASNPMNPDHMNI